MDQIGRKTTVFLLALLSATQISLAAEPVEHQNFHEIRDIQLNQRFAHRLDSALNVTNRFVHIRFVRTGMVSYQMIATIYTKENVRVFGNLYFQEGTNKYLMYGDLPDRLIRKIGEPRIIVYQYTDKEDAEQENLAWRRIFNYDDATGIFEELDYSEYEEREEQIRESVRYYNVRDIKLDMRFLSGLDSVLNVNNRIVYLSFVRKDMTSSQIKVEIFYKPFPNACFYECEYRNNKIMLFNDVPSELIVQVGEPMIVPYVFSHEEFRNTMDPFYTRIFDYDTTTRIWNELDFGEYIRQQQYKYDTYIK